ncbi:MAG: chorismate mutase [Candidatus Thermoplasmatota archaeon]|nr:chorismate mutase [Candidatus Thermoplasmatota archaeon]
MDLKEIRKEMDDIDSDIFGLLVRRMVLSIKAGRVKSKLEDKEREKQILRSLKEKSGPPITPDFLERLYISIISESKKLQQEEYKLAAFQGERGAFGEVACREFDKDLIPVPCKDFSDVFEGVLNGEFDIGVVPIENSSEGAITSVSHLVSEGNLNIVGEVTLQIHHSLLSHQKVSLEDVRVVYSHPQALAQCRDFIARNKIESRPFYDTAGAAMMIAREKPAGAAAIANKACASIYGLKVLKEEVEDSRYNYTRFIVLSREKSLGEGNKCSITFLTEDKVGALTTVLNIFKDEGINLTMITSIPSRDSTGRSKFLIDFKGHFTDNNVQRTLKKIKGRTVGFRLLGCYRGWEL